MSRHHHSADHVHHHHWCECIHAPGVLYQGGGHLPLGQFRLCLLICVGVRRCQLPVHRPGPPRAQDEREGTISGLFLLHAVWCCKKSNINNKRHHFPHQPRPFSCSGSLWNFTYMSICQASWIQLRKQEQQQNKDKNKDQEQSVCVSNRVNCMVGATSHPCKMFNSFVSNS